MSRPLFLAERADLSAGQAVVLGGGEGRHAAMVRRIRVGEQVELGDGRGRVATCEVLTVSRHDLRCAVLEARDVPAPQPRLVVVQALAKGEPAELAVELMTELGVDVVVPWAAARGVVRWDTERSAHGEARWRATAREAVKQSRRAWLPEVSGLRSTEAVADLVAAAELAVVLDRAAAAPLAGMALPSGGDVVVVVGPEGGITPEERAAFMAAGGQPARLGPEMLRTSTAGAAALAVLSAAGPRWR